MAIKTRLKLTQGPMSEDEAAQVASRYKQRGYDVVVTSSFHDAVQKHVYVYYRAPAGASIAWRNAYE